MTDVIELKTVPKLVKSAGSAVDAISGLLKNKLPEEPDAMEIIQKDIPPVPEHVDRNEQPRPKVLSGSAVDAISGLLKNKLPEEPDAKALRLERLESCAETLL